MNVALFTRAWIEIDMTMTVFLKMLSPSSRGRGLKCGTITENIKSGLVALFTRAWIEIKSKTVLLLILKKVALFTRAWIEIPLPRRARAEALSPSSRGRGLKYIIFTKLSYSLHVALFTRAWIEIVAEFYKNKKFLSRPLHEGVD